MLENDHNIMIVTETWLDNLSDESVIHELLPAGYLYVSNNRKKPRRRWHKCCLQRNSVTKPMKKGS